MPSTKSEACGTQCRHQNYLPEGVSEGDPSTPTNLGKALFKISFCASCFFWITERAWGHCTFFIGGCLKSQLAVSQIGCWYSSDFRLFNEENRLFQKSISYFKGWCRWQQVYFQTFRIETCLQCPTTDLHGESWYFRVDPDVLHTGVTRSLHRTRHQKWQWVILNSESRLGRGISPSMLLNRFNGDIPIRWCE